MLSVHLKYFFIRLLKFYLLCNLIRKKRICHFGFSTLRSLEVATRNIQQAGFISQLIQWPALLHLTGKLSGKARKVKSPLQLVGARGKNSWMECPK